MLTPEIHTMLAQKYTLKLEIKGMKHSSGRSVYAHIKKTYGLRGNKERVLEQFSELIDKIAMDAGGSNG